MKQEYYCPACGASFSWTEDLEFCPICEEDSRGTHAEPLNVRELPEKKDIVRSWDVECGCSVASLIKEIHTIQQKFGLNPNEGYITTFTNAYETVFMVFSETWITQDEAKIFVTEIQQSVWKEENQEKIDQ